MSNVNMAFAVDFLFMFSISFVSITRNRLSTKTRNRPGGNIMISIVEISHDA